MSAEPPARVIHVTECLTGRTLAVLRRSITELDTMGVEQTLVYSRRRDTPMHVGAMFPPRIELREIAPARGAHRAFVSQLRGVLRKLTELDRAVIHLHSSKAGFAGRLLMASLDQPGCRCLYSPHGLAYANPARQRGRPMYWLLEKFAGRFPFEPVADLADELWALQKLSGRRAHLLELAVGDEFFDVTPQWSARPSIVARGPVRAWRDPDAFGQLSIASVIADIHADFVWVGAGDKDREARLKSSSVTVTGELPDSQAAEIFSRAWIFMQLSKRDDSPLSLHQAMAAGVPCVVSNTYANRNAIRHGESGFIVETPDDVRRCIELLLHSAELRRRLGQTAREVARERFGRERFRQRLRQLYALPARTATQADYEQSPFALVQSDL